MIQSPSSFLRTPIPRWRTLTRTLISCELAFPQGKHNAFVPREITPELVKRLEAWRREPGLITAAELIETAIVFGQEREAIDAARYILKNDNAVPLVRISAAHVFKVTGLAADIPKDIHSSHVDATAVWRKRTRLVPHDGIAWIELSLRQLSKGNKEKALQSMAVARQLMPHNRHAIRASARLLLHVGEAEGAHRLVLRNPATPHDPWLIAAEIALAKHANRDPRFIKAGRAMVDNDQFIPRQISELASALGSTLLTDGNTKKGKQYLRQSVLDPTGNSLAQAEWESQRVEEDFVGQDKLEKSRDAKEAMTLHHYSKGEYEQSLKFAHEWIEEEPFSKRAYRAGASAANALEEHIEAEKLARAGLRFDPKFADLHHALIFSVACQNRLDDAERLLDMMPGEKDSDLNKNVAAADRGLIAYRRGNHAEGEAHYRRAIAGFKRAQMLSMEQLALAFFAKEAAKAKSPNAIKILAEAIQNTKNASVLTRETLRPLIAAEAFLGSQNHRLFSNGKEALDLFTSLFKK